MDLDSLEAWAADVLRREGYPWGLDPSRYEDELSVVNEAIENNQWDAVGAPPVSEQAQQLAPALARIILRIRHARKLVEAGEDIASVVAAGFDLGVRYERALELGAPKKIDQR